MLVGKIKNITAFLIGKGLWVFYLGPSRSPSRFVLGNLLWVLVIDLKGKKLNSTLGLFKVYFLLHCLVATVTIHIILIINTFTSCLPLYYKSSRSIFTTSQQVYKVLHALHLTLNFTTDQNKNILMSKS